MVRKADPNAKISPARLPHVVPQSPFVARFCHLLEAIEEFSHTSLKKKRIVVGGTAHISIDY